MEPQYIALYIAIIAGCFSLTQTIISVTSAKHGKIIARVDENQNKIMDILAEQSKILAVLIDNTTENKEEIKALRKKYEDLTKEVAELKGFAQGARIVKSA